MSTPQLFSARPAISDPFYSVSKWCALFEGKDGRVLCD